LLPQTAAQDGHTRGNGAMRGKETVLSRRRYHEGEIITATLNAKGAACQ
jgi:hypothetical protein